MSELYDDALLGLARAMPGLAERPTHTGTAKNRFCADELRVGLVVVDDRVQSVGWAGEACAVCRASAARLAELLTGRPVSEVDEQEAQLEAVLAGADEGPWSGFARVRRHPSRAACARLPFEAVRLALGVGEAQARRDAAPTEEAWGSRLACPVTALAPDPWSAALQFRERGLGVALATLVEVVGSSPCPVGSKMAIASSGEFWGAVSGGCVESAVVQAALELLEGRREPGVEAYQIANSQAGEVGLPCGGRVRIRIEHAPGDDPLRAARAAWLAKRDRLVLVGGTRVAQVLAELAGPLELEVIVVEPRPGFAGPGRFGVEVRVDRPERVLPELLGPRTAVVMLTHDAAVDDPGLRVALASDAFYVGALGSRKTQGARLERLSAAGVPGEHLARLRGPAGLSIGAVGPAEIALSILAEVVAARRSAEPSQVGSVVLAAGSSRRAGPANKLLNSIDGEAMVRRVVRATVEAALGPVVVVLGHQADAVRAVLSDLPVQLVVNDEHQAGMGRSIAVGIEAVAAHGVSAAFVVLGDMPWLRGEDLRRLAATHTAATRDLVIVPVAGQGEERRRGNPVLWPSRYFAALMGLRGDVGGKGILAAAPGAVLEVGVDGDGVLLDVDG